MIKIEKLNKKYGSNHVLNDLDYQFNNNKITCILGPSGCGKTTLLNLIAGFDDNYSGSIKIDGDCINSMNAQQLCEYRKNNVGFIFQNYHLINGYSVLENILLAAELNDFSEKDNTIKATELLEQFNMQDKINAKVENLSGGQKQRVAIARALINNPSIILADEPTGALDRESSNQIMSILQEISKDKLIIIITHDKKICEYAKETIEINDGKINVIKQDDVINIQEKKSIEAKMMTKEPSVFKRAKLNFKNHLTKYIFISIAIAMGISFFMMSLSSKNMITQSIDDFKEKNTAFNNGYIKLDTEDPFDELSSNEMIENVYYQYIIKNITLSNNEISIIMDEKIPMPKAVEDMSFGTMPKRFKNEIALSPSLAKKFVDNPTDLLNQSIKFHYQGKDFELTVSGIYNAGYDDFYISSDIEQELYQLTDVTDKFSVTYDVIDFENIVSINKELADLGYGVKSASEQVGSLQSTFDNLQRLFMVLSILFLVISLFISVVLLTKIMNSRYREVALLTAIGYNKKQITKILLIENILLASVATILSIVILVMLSIGLNSFLGIKVSISNLQVAMSGLLTFVVILSISISFSYKLINEQVAIGLKK